MTAEKFIPSLAAIIYLVATTNFCLALESIEFVTPERAKALGLEIRANAAGPQVVHVEVEFEAKGELQNYARVALEMHEGDKLITTSTLKEEPKPGRILVSFAADRASLNKITLKVVTQDSLRTRIGRVLRMHEFVDLAKLR